MEQEEQWSIKDSDDDVPTILLNTSIAIFTAPPVIAGNASFNSYVMDNDDLFGSDTDKVVVSRSEERE
jgi:hypothetical protein